MKVYQEITLKPQPEIPLNFLWEKLYQQIHLALVENQLEQSDNKTSFGLSFPHYDEHQYTLGCKLRVFSKTSEKMQELALKHWLNRMSDYCYLSTIESVPTNTLFARFSRKQVKSNIQRIARRRSKNTGEFLEQTVEYLKAKGFQDQKTKLPYVFMESCSTSENSKNRHRFRLFIEKEMVKEPIEGVFTSYGLSKKATIPWF